ncbi:MAG: hypothetical protein KIS67_27455 [Verrucomicrobiae bacterium]|nr:hypothetical protein [Verrucomicrobiae bacterium]
MTILLTDPFIDRPLYFTLRRSGAARLRLAQDGLDAHAQDAGNRGHIVGAWNLSAAFPIADVPRACPRSAMPDRKWHRRIW